MCRARRLSAEAVSLVVKARAAAVGLDPSRYAGHSLRAGLATSAAAAGVSSWKIRGQTGHASDAMLRRYIRDGEMFVDNAAGAVLGKKSQWLHSADLDSHTAVDCLGQGAGWTTRRMAQRTWRTRRPVGCTD